MPRRNSLIFSVNLWQPSGSEPDTIWQVLGRLKDIQYASRGKSHVARQEQIHRMRHVIRELVKHIPEAERDDPMVQELASYGCSTIMHLVRLLSPRLDGEDHTKDIDFTPRRNPRALAGRLRTRQARSLRKALGLRRGHAAGRGSSRIVGIGRRRPRRDFSCRDHGYRRGIT